ncbi:MAG: peptidoglycan DD-metalloendopeptidase family protein [Saprospiraceae bacterium]
MKRSIKSGFVLVLWIVSATILLGQTRQELEKQRMLLLKEIEKTSKQLENTTKTKEKSISQLKVLDEQMNSRKKLIKNLQTEVSVNDQLINNNVSKIKELRERHIKLSDQYKVILRASYLKKLSHSKWTYLLSADNLNNLLLRWRYLHQFDNYTQQKLKDIQFITGEIELKNKEIARTKENKILTLNETNKNMQSLEKEQKEKDQIVKKLSQEESKLLANLNRREKDREKLNSAIEKIIIAEMAKAKVKEKEDKTTMKAKEIDNTAFSKNQGALSWPIKSGKISGRFGTHPHPSLKGIEVSNNGVDFVLPNGDDVICIYDGEVVGVTNIQGIKNMVIIKHGNYFTVYSKLDTYTVSRGQKIKRGQKIGEVLTGEDGKAELHFELWKDKVKLDPERWFNK